MDISPKYCPLSFFSFFTNKKASQCGGAMMCVKNQCAWWDEILLDNGEISGQCAFLSLVDGIRNISDLPTLLPIAKNIDNKELSKKLALEQLNQEIVDIKKEVNEPSSVSDLLNKLRSIGKENSTTLTEEVTSSPLVNTTSEIAGDSINGK